MPLCAIASFLVHTGNTFQYHIGLPTCVTVYFGNFAMLFYKCSFEI